MIISSDAMSNSIHFHTLHSKIYNATQNGQDFSKPWSSDACFMNAPDYGQN